MGVINLSRDGKDALARVNTADLSRLVDTAIYNERIGDLQCLPLRACGLFVSSKLDSFQRALTDHSQAKSSRKDAETAEILQRAGHRLVSAVGQMQGRMELEEQEGKLFQVDDRIMQPFQLGERLNVIVDYKWRRSEGEAWIFGRINFEHHVEIRQDYRWLASKRKLSTTKRAQERESILYHSWENLRKTALYSVREFFRSGGDGRAIPQTFRAIVAPHSCELNNYSCRFWNEPSVL